MIVLPLGSYMILLPKVYENLDDDTIKGKFGFFYEEVKPTDRWNVAYYALFITRRFIFVCYMLFLSGPVTIEILLVLYLNLTYLIYLGQNAPVRIKYFNWLDQYNEYFICLWSFFLVAFSDHFLTVEKYFFGRLFIILVLIHLIPNLIILLIQVLHRLRLLWLRFLFPYWMRYISPLLHCWPCRRWYINFRRKRLLSLPGVSLDEMKNNPDGFSETYLIMQRMTTVKGILEKRNRKKQEH